MCLCVSVNYKLLYSACVDEFPARVDWVCVARCDRFQSVASPFRDGRYPIELRGHYHVRANHLIKPPLYIGRILKLLQIYITTSLLCLCQLAHAIVAN